WQRSSTAIEIAGYSSVSGTVTGRGEPQTLAGTTSIGGMFQVLGMQPLFGRALTIADEDPGSPQTIVLSYETWHELFGENRAALGQSLTVNGTPRTIVGVMPPGYSFLGGPSDFYVPSRFD